MKNIVSEMESSSSDVSSSAGEIKLDGFDSLINNSKPMVNSDEDVPQTDYSTKEKVLSIVDEGYTRLPGIYKEVFLDPIKNHPVLAAIADKIQTMDAKETLKNLIGVEVLSDLLTLHAKGLIVNQTAGNQTTGQ
jgi:hypothetical protein